MRELWRTNRMKNQFTSSVLHDGFIYGLDEAILACLDAKTGERKWKGGRYGYGQLLLAAGHLIVVTERGNWRWCARRRSVTRKWSDFRRSRGNLDHPVIVDGRLLVRNISEMAAFDLRR